MSATDPNIFVFQHIAIEHPGVFRDFLREDGLGWTAVELDEGEPIPDLGAYDALRLCVPGPLHHVTEASSLRRIPNPRPQRR